MGPQAQSWGIPTLHMVYIFLTLDFSKLICYVFLCRENTKNTRQGNTRTVLHQTHGFIIKREEVSLPVYKHSALKRDGTTCFQYKEECRDKASRHYSGKVFG